MTQPPADDLAEKAADETMAEQERINEGVTRYIGQMPLPETLEQAIAERDAWIESACMFSRNEDYYRGLVEQVGKLLGDEAYIADDGSRSQDILNDKVPDLAAAELTRLRAMCDELAVAVEPFAAAAVIIEADRKIWIERPVNETGELEIEHFARAAAIYAKYQNSKMKEHEDGSV